MQQILTTLVALLVPLTAIHAQLDEIQWLSKLSTPANTVFSDIEPHAFEVNGSGQITLLASYYSTVVLANGTTTLQHNGPFGEDRLAVIRYDKNGSWQWTNTIQAEGPIPSGVFNREARLAADEAGNAYVAGRLFANSLAFGNGISIEKSCASACEELFLAKYNPTGQPQWAYPLQAFGTSMHSVAGVDCDAEGNVYLLGISGGGLIVYRDTFFDGLTNNQQFLMKLDADGKAIWFNALEPGSGLAFARMLRVGHDGAVYVSGNYTSATLSFGNNIVLPPHGIYNGYVVKYSPDGVPQNGKIFTGKSVDMLDMHIDMAGRIYLACDLEKNLKFDNQTLTTSTSEYNAMLIRIETDNTPNVIYKIDYNNSDYFPVLTNMVRPDGSVFYAGGVFGGVLEIGPNELESAGKTDILLVESDENGILTPIRLGGPEVEAMENFQYGSAMGLDANGYLYILGFNGKDAEVGSHFFDDAGIFIARLKTSSVNALAPAPQKANISPNPTNGYFKLELPGLQGLGQCRIADLGGRIVHEMPITSAKTTIFAPLNQGVFTLTVKDDSATYYAKLVVR